uniref:DUF262 domain-containing protein n=1 Tax=Flavobacterium sp. TaxID=239 RepID=UPI0040490659
MNKNISIKEMSFLDLINEHQIVIPIIQRDYVHGRINNNADEIRKDFLQEIKNVVTNKIPFLRLGFVYGKVLDKDFQIIKKKNKSAIEGVLNSLKDYAKHLDEEITFSVDWNTKTTNEDSLGFSKFIPLDGQQRLTTLFLFHWYIINQSKQKNEFITLLNRFKYDTRKKTQEFISSIIEKEIELDYNSDISTQLIKQTWFFHQWLQDPSVKAMLNTLDSIHTTFKDLDTLEIWKNIEKGTIRFDYLDVEELEQTDEIYVKMNARGKQLSDFEHFKAWLQGHIKEEDNKITIAFENWEDKLDVEWIDLFWSENNVEKTDDSYLMFFQNIGFSGYASNMETLFTNSLYNEIKSKKFEDRFLSLVDNSELFASDTLNHIFNVLNFLQKENINSFDKSIEDVLNIDKYSLKKVLLDGNEFEKLSQNDEIIVQGIIYYGINSIEKNIEFEKNNFEQWLRIIRNLAANTFIQGIDNYTDALISLKNLSKYCFEIESKLLETDFSIEFFNGEQQKEERLKIEKFQISNNWRFAINKFEKHNYFNGQIGFFFDVLEIEEQTDLKKFIFYGDKLCHLFGEILDDKYSTLQATLLSQVDYTIKKSSKWTFLDKRHNDLRSRFDNWRKIFNKNFKSSGEIIPFEGLKKIIRDNKSLVEIKSSAVLNDWRYIFTKNKALIEYCNNNHFYFEEQHNIQLLRGTTFTGKSFDAYLYFTLKKIKKSCKKLTIEAKEINGNKSKDNYSEIIITLLDNKTILKLYYNPNQDFVRFSLKIEGYKKTKYLDDISKTLSNYFIKNNDQNYVLEFDVVDFLENQENEFNSIVKCFINIENINP